ncbi:MAG: PqqD family peptide modification chaperone [Clostridia bacterium]|nr:PqqD family peptide modification chaperone [Clostridia bacterium]
MLTHAHLVVYRLGEGFLYASPKSRMPAFLRVSPDYADLEAWTPPCADAGRQEEALIELLRAALECRAALEGTLFVHGACVETGGKALVFTGDSGRGKSTRAAAWVAGCDASWLSGDRPALRITSRGAIVCGVPWDGKEQVFRQAEFPLRAIMEVRRADFTRLRRLSPAQARAMLARQCFLPMWDARVATRAFALLLRASAELTVYRLFCGPGEEDARAVREILNRFPENIFKEATDMKIKDGFVLRDVVGEQIVMPAGENISRFDGALLLNEVSAYIWERLQAPISREDLLEMVLSEFDVERAVAERDLDAMLDKLRALNVLEE